MSTSIQSAREISSSAKRSSASTQRWSLPLLVFLAGACSLSVEIAASRLLAPYFGDTLFVWASLIGLILLYLTVGYYLGGRLADRFPRASLLYTLTLVAAILIALIPLLGHFVLAWAQQAFAGNALGVFYGSMVSVLVLFVLPTVLLGCVSPFALRLRLGQVGKAGRTAGRLYALSTLGSLLGTFLPVLLLLPDIGTSKTFLFSGMVLGLFALLGLWQSRGDWKMSGEQMPSPGLTERGERLPWRTVLASYNMQTWLCITLVFIEGACSLALEVSASRLLAPYFGTSLFIWTALIGLILLYLTIGYFVGGWLADRRPSAGLLYTLTLLAALLIALLPWLARPLMQLSVSAFTSYSAVVFLSSLGGTLLLFAIPVILLGCVSPFAFRLQMRQVGRTGNLAGKLYAISTAGSMVGTFLPTLLLIPSIGTYHTFFVFALALALISLLGLFCLQPDQAIQWQFPRIGLRLLAALLLIPIIWSFFAIQGPIKLADGSAGYGNGVLLAERESAYNYIQVVQVGNQTQLILNEGVGIHSVYDPNNILTGSEWDYFLDAPFFNNPPFTQAQIHTVCIIGLGAGTIPRLLTAAYGPLPIDGVELDPEIVRLGRQYFHMTEPNLHVIIQDGRYYLSTTQKKYDEIGIDAYQQPYVPFQLTTKEFFQEVRDHLTPTGVAVINAGRTGTDFRLVEALAQTMHAVFPGVYIMDTPLYDNSVIVATNMPTALQNLAINALSSHNQLVREVAINALQVGNLRAEMQRKVYFTDDQAPVEQLIDSIIFDAVRDS